MRTRRNPCRVLGNAWRICSACAGDIYLCHREIGVGILCCVELPSLPLRRIWAFWHQPSQSLLLSLFFMEYAKGMRIHGMCSWYVKLLFWQKCQVWIIHLYILCAYNLHVWVDEWSCLSVGHHSIFCSACCVIISSLCKKREQRWSRTFNIFPCLPC